MGAIPHADAPGLRHLQEDLKGFVLTTTIDRAWSEYRAASEARIGRAWQFAVPDLIARRQTLGIDAAVWLLQRLGWLEIARRSLEIDQQDLLQRRW